MQPLIALQRLWACQSQKPGFKQQSSFSFGWALHWIWRSNVVIVVPPHLGIWMKCKSRKVGSPCTLIATVFGWKLDKSSVLGRTCCGYFFTRVFCSSSGVNVGCAWLDWNHTHNIAHNVTIVESSRQRFITVPSRHLAVDFIINGTGGNHNSINTLYPTIVLE